MAKYVKSEDIGRLWVTQAQPSAQSSSASFDGKRFFSYATVIAQIAENSKGRKAFIVNQSKYSSTTSFWQGLVKDAIPATAKVFYVEGVNRSSTFFDHKRIMGCFRAAINWRERDAELAREPKKTRFIKEAKEIRARMKAYAKFFSV